MVPVDELSGNEHLMLMTQRGYVKRVPLSEFATARQGTAAMGLVSIADSLTLSLHRSFGGLFRKGWAQSSHRPCLFSASSNALSIVARAVQDQD